MWLRGSTRHDSLARDLAQAAVDTNTFLCTVSLLPIPGIDGGPILKWALVANGRTPTEADTVVRKVDGVLGIGLAAAGAVALKKRRWLLGALCVQLAVAALGIALGFLKE